MTTKMENLQTVYSYFSLDEWKTIATSIVANTQLTLEQKKELLVKMPSACIPDKLGFKTFQVYWRGGKHETFKGSDVEEVLDRHYAADAVPAFYEERDEVRYVFNSETQLWDLVDSKNP